MARTCRSLPGFDLKCFEQIEHGHHVANSEKCSWLRGGRGIVPSSGVS